MSFDKLTVPYDEILATWHNIFHFLKTARKAGKEGPVAQHLVGAKLQLRFPEIQIGNESYSTADDQLGRPGDFIVGDTAFHVTVAPMPAVYDKCKSNLGQGLRVYLIVPDRSLNGARQNAALMLSGLISVESIESFVSQNIDEITLFSKSKLIGGFRRLLETYNDRVNEAEIDKSMLVEIPRNLL